MITNHAYADCKVEHQVVDSTTGALTWQLYENVSFEAPNLGAVMERVDLYIGIPNSRAGVSAVLLTGKIHTSKKDVIYETTDTVTLDLHILRKTNTMRLTRRKSS